MNDLYAAGRGLFRKGRNDIMKIVSLGTGLAVGIILIAKVFYELSYENFYPGRSDIYQVYMNYILENDRNPDNENEYYYVSGGVAPGMKAEIPSVAAATRFTQLGRGMTLETSQGNKVKATVILADSCFYDVLPRPMVSGNAKKILSRPGYAIVSESLAEKIGPDAVGSVIWSEKYPDKKIVIGGVFRDIPKNTAFGYDMAVSMSSIGDFMWDGSMNWDGNERYAAFVKLLPGTDVAALAGPMRSMQGKYQDLEEMKEAGENILYGLTPISSVHSGKESSKRSNLMLSLLAAAVITAAVMNYVLAAISSLVGRTREMAVHKCYGASSGRIAGMIFAETAVTLAASLLFAGALITVFRSTAERLLSTDLGVLFSPESCMLLAGVCAVIFLVAGYIPSAMFMKVPVAVAFRSYKNSRRMWKLCLLFVQCVAVVCLSVLMSMVTRQYNAMMSFDPGYEYTDVAYMNLEGLGQNTRRSIVEELRSLPQVEYVSYGQALPISSYSGNMVYDSDGIKQLFSISDLSYAGPHYLDVLGVKMIEGNGFTEGKSVPGDKIVSRSFAERLTRAMDWKDGVVGKEVKFTEYGQARITGVYEDFTLGGADYGTSKTPTILTYTDEITGFITVKLRKLDGDAVSRMNETLAAVVPDRKIPVIIYADVMYRAYSRYLKFRDSVMIGCIVTMVILVMGLAGYVGNEVNRRGGEIAIRKVNGARSPDIIKLFIADILKITLPASVLGCAAGVLLVREWQEGFSLKATMPWWLFVTCTLAITGAVVAVVVSGCVRIARRNPAEALKNE